MYWTCKSCGTRNPENARKCGKCSSTADATRKFYTASIIGSGLVFAILYLVGTSIGGTLVAFSLEPTDGAVLAAAKAQGSDAKKLENVAPADQKKAREAAIAKGLSEMSLAVHSVLFWFVPFLLFPIIGMAVGFVSQGRTVIEAALGSVIGQVLGYAGMRFMYKVDIHWMELVIGLVLGFLTTAAGAYVGEAIQEKRERAVLTEQDEEEEALG